MPTCSSTIGFESCRIIAKPDRSTKCIEIPIFMIDFISSIWKDSWNTPRRNITKRQMGTSARLAANMAHSKFSESLTRCSSCYDKLPRHISAVTSVRYCDRSALVKLRKSGMALAILTVQNRFFSLPTAYKAGDSVPLLVI